MGPHAPAQGRVQGPGGDVDVRLVSLSWQGRAAGLAAGDGIGLAQDIGDPLILPTHPSELVAGHNEDGVSIGPTGLTAEGTVADPDSVNLAVDLIGPCATEAAAGFEGHGISPVEIARHVQLYVIIRKFLPQP